MKFTSLLVSALAGFSLASPLIERRGSSGASVSTTTNNEVQMTDPTVSNLANGVTNLVGQVNQIGMRSVPRLPANQVADSTGATAITLSGLTAGTVGVTTSDATKTLTDELSQVNATIASVLSAANALETDASSILLPLGETLVGFVTSQVGSALQTLFDEVTLVQSFTGTSRNKQSGGQARAETTSHADMLPCWICRPSDCLARAPARRHDAEPEWAGWQAE
jgi:hypothetical protein